MSKKSPKNVEIKKIGEILSHFFEIKPGKWVLHRLDGPAIIYAAGDHCVYYIYGKYHTEETFRKNPLVKAFNKIKGKEDKDRANSIINI